MDLKRHFLIALSFVFICVAIVAAKKVHENIRIRKSNQIDLAEFQHVRFGLLNPHEWKRKVSVIISESLDNMDLDKMNREEIRAQIIIALERLFRELDILMEKKVSEGSWLKRFASAVVLDVAEMDQLKNNIPDLADSILEELNTPEARENLKMFIQNKINEMVENSIGKEEESTIDQLLIKNQCDNREDCILELDKSIQALSIEITMLSILEIGCVIFVFVFWYILKDEVFRGLQWYALLTGIIIILISGITTPMINIDARINEVSMTFLDKEIIFKDQILFFQSKSILDVVIILIKYGDFQTILVGILILMFSIVFPVLKLLSSFILNIKRSLQSNNILNFIAFKTGKWSMADVFVVSIFMAYIGFRGILDSQLNQLETLSSKAQIIATDHSSLEIGVLFFTVFVVISIVFSSLSQRKLSIE